jgi:hypothetical protein
VTRRTRRTSSIVMAMAMLCAAAGAAAAQQAPAPAPAPAATEAPTLLRVQVVISRYQDGKRLSRQPYSLNVTASGPRGHASLRMGLQVAVPVVAAPEGKTTSSVVYKDVGTSIDCTATKLDDGRFRLDISLEDSSLMADAPGAGAASARGIPQFRSFRLSGQTAILRDGQSTELTTAAEKLGTDIAKVDVSLDVVK